MRGYQWLLRVTLARPYVTLVAGLGLFALSLWSTTLLPTGFIPPQDDSRIVMSLELPPGATLADTRAKTDAVARAFLTEPGVTHRVRGGRRHPHRGRRLRSAPPPWWRRWCPNPSAAAARRRSRRRCPATWPPSRTCMAGW